jgi:hypothetical protein
MGLESMDWIKLNQDSSVVVLCKHHYDPSGSTNEASLFVT